MELRTIPLLKNEYQNFIFNKNSVDLVSKIKADIYYLDPPYNQRQYAPNYHLLETIAKYDNLYYSPKIGPVSKLIKNYILAL